MHTVQILYETRALLLVTEQFGQRGRQLYSVSPCQVISDQTSLLGDLGKAASVSWSFGFYSRHRREAP